MSEGGDNILLFGKVAAISIAEHLAAGYYINAPFILPMFFNNGDVFIYVAEGVATLAAGMASYAALNAAIQNPANDN